MMNTWKQFLVKESPEMQERVARRILKACLEIEADILQKERTTLIKKRVTRNKAAFSAISEKQ